MPIYNRPKLPRNKYGFTTSGNLIVGGGTTIIQGELGPSSPPDLSNYYNRVQVDSLLATKANISDTYDKASIDSLFIDKASTQDLNQLKTYCDNVFALDEYTYSSQECDDLFQLKTDAANYLPLSGGTMSGPIYLQNTNQSIQPSTTEVVEFVYDPDTALGEMQTVTRPSLKIQSNTLIEFDAPKAKIGGDLWVDSVKVNDLNYQFPNYFLKADGSLDGTLYAAYDNTFQTIIFGNYNDKINNQQDLDTKNYLNGHPGWTLPTQFGSDGWYQAFDTRTLNKNHNIFALKGGSGITLSNYNFSNYYGLKIEADLSKVPLKGQSSSGNNLNSVFAGVIGYGDRNNSWGGYFEGSEGAIKTNGAVYIETYSARDPKPALQIAWASGTNEREKSGTLLDCEGAINTESKYTISGIDIDSIYSDSRLKKDIKALNQWDTNPIKEVSYRFCVDETDREHFGYLAQDVESVYSDLVQTDTKGIKRLNIVELLVKEIADLKNEIRELKKQINHENNQDR